MALLRLIPALSAAPVPELKAQEEIRDIIKNIAKDIAQEAKNNMTSDGGWGSKVRGGKDLISLLRESSFGLTSMARRNLTSVVQSRVRSSTTVLAKMNYWTISLLSSLLVTKRPAVPCVTLYIHSPKTKIFNPACAPSS